MSKFFHVILAVVVLFTTSCMKESYSSDITLTANLGGIESRAIADGTTVNQIAWAVYASGSDTPLKNLWGTMPLSNRQATLDLSLANGKSYDIVFFAYYTENPNHVVDIHGEINPLYYDLSFTDKSITVKYDNATANDEKRDCFWHVVRGMKVEGAANRTFKLTRPLAQLNLGVTETDYNTALNSDFRIANTEITVDSYTKFNIFDGTLSELKPTTITFAGTQTPLYSDEYLIIDGQSERYKYLATTYLLVDKKCTSNVSVKIWDNSGYELHTLNYSFVPFQRNYRTNIIGHLLTNPNLFTIVLEKKFDGDSE